MTNIVFGEDGNDTSYDIGEVHTYDESAITVPIKNISNKELCAYAYIGYDDNEAHKHFGLSTVSGGNYIYSDDGEVIGQNNLQRLKSGVNNNTFVNNNGVVLLTGHIAGTYTSPVFKINDSKLLSYAYYDVISTSNVNVSLEIRSSSIKPDLIEEVYFYYGGKLHRDIINGTSIFSGWPISVSSANCVCVNSITGKVVNNYGSTISIHDVDGSVISTYNSSSKTTFSRMEYKPDGPNFWGYSPTWGGFVYINDSTLSVISEYRHSSQEDFIVDFFVALNGVGVWYIDANTSRLIRINNVCEEVFSKGFTNLTAVCATDDGGCWAADNVDDDKIYSYRFNGNNEAIEYVNLDNSVDLMCNGYNNNFWYMHSNTLYYVDTNKYTETLIGYYDKISFIKAFNDKLILHSSTLHVTTVINNNGFILKTLYGDSNDCGVPDVFYMNDTEQQLPSSYTFPIDSDIDWGVNGLLQWEILNNGYVLPKKNYYQINVVFTTVSGVVSDTILKSIAFQPPIKVGNLQPQEYKNVYIKPRFEVGDTPDTYNTNFKVWWEEV